METRVISKKDGDARDQTRDSTRRGVTDSWWENTNGTYSSKKRKGGSEAGVSLEVTLMEHDKVCLCGYAATRLGKKQSQRKGAGKM